MELLLVLAHIEIVIVVLAVISNSLLTFLIYKASSLHYNCRGLLLIFSASMYLLSLSHGMTVFEFLYEKQSYEYIYFVSSRGFIWRTIHEFGYCLQSLSLVLFSIERLVASICPTAYQSMRVKLIFIILSLLSVVISTLFTLGVHLGNQMFWPTLPMNVIDISGCIILLIAWRRSIHRYRTTVGVLSLEQRFQLSEVYTWSRHLIPAVALASFSKLLVMAVIWLLITGEYKGNDAALWLIVYNNVLNVYTVIVPFVVIAKHQKIREKMSKKPKEDFKKTIDGRVIPSRHDYFEHMKQNWK